MPSESDRPIEKQLRAYADQRRRAAGEEDFRIHPITRNSLKVEIVNQYGRRLPGAREERSFWSVLWTRLALAGGGALVLFLAFRVFQPGPVDTRSPDLTVALNDSETRRAEPELADDTPSPAAGEPFPGIRSSFPEPAVAGEAAPTRPEQVYRFYPVPSTDDSSSETMPTSRPASAPAPTRQLVKISKERRVQPNVTAPSEPPTMATADPAAGVGGRPPLLASFQLKLRGDRVVVVDADQSEYAGRIQPMDPARLGGMARAIGPGDLSDTTDPAFPRNYRLYSEQGGMGSAPAAGEFTVRGTNVSSGKEVQFTGRMLTWTQEVSRTGVQAGGPASILRVQGTATVDGQPSIFINATTQPQVQPEN